MLANSISTYWVNFYIISLSIILNLRHHLFIPSTLKGSLLSSLHRGFAPYWHHSWCTENSAPYFATRWFTKIAPYKETLSLSWVSAEIFWCQIWNKFVPIFAPILQHCAALCPDQTILTFPLSFSFPLSTTLEDKVGWKKLGGQF